MAQAARNTNSRYDDAPQASLQDPEASHHSDILSHEEDTDSDGEDDRRLLILYASQTGSAQDVAEYIGREAWRRHFVARVQDIRDFDKVRLRTRFADCSLFYARKANVYNHYGCFCC